MSAALYKRTISGMLNQLSQAIGQADEHDLELEARLGDLRIDLLTGAHTLGVVDADIFERLAADPELIDEHFRG